LPEWQDKRENKEQEQEERYHLSPPLRVDRLRSSDGPLPVEAMRRMRESTPHKGMPGERVSTGAQ
jgi:hypothetical protein